MYEERVREEKDRCSDKWKGRVKEAVMSSTVAASFSGVPDKDCGSVGNIYSYTCHGPVAARC